MSYRMPWSELDKARTAVRWAAEVVYTQIKPAYRGATITATRSPTTGTVLFSVTHPVLNDGNPILAPAHVARSSAQELRDHAVTFLMLTIC